MQCKYALLLSYLELHISFLEVGSKAKHQCLGEDTNTIEWIESTIWEVWAMLLIAKVTKTPSILHGGYWRLGVIAVPLFNCPRRQGRHFKIHKNKEWNGMSVMVASYLLKSCFIVTFTFAWGRAKNKCGGACWRSLTQIFCSPKYI
jgi:hypothetical protein